MTLTTYEFAALKIAFRSAAGNGHDFGFTEDIVDGMRPLNPQQVGAIITSLVKKGIFEMHDAVTTDSGTWTQFTWLMDVETVAAIIMVNTLPGSAP